MVLTVDFRSSGDVVRWALADDGVTRTVHDGYTPTLFVGDAVRDLYGRRGGRTPTPPDRDGLSDSLTELQAFLAGQDAVVDTGRESYRQTFRTSPRPLLRIDAASVDAVRRIARRVQQFNGPAEYTCHTSEGSGTRRCLVRRDANARIGGEDQRGIHNRGSRTRPRPDLMVVVDSFALIPLAWVGRLELVSTAFDEIRTTELVQNEVLTEGKRGTAALDTFLVDIPIHGTPAAADDVAVMEGIAVADASVILLAEADEEILLANDKGLIEVARSHGVNC